MSLVLIGHPLSSFCQKVTIALAETGLPFTLKLLDFGDAEQGRWFSTLSPFNKIPVLLDGDRVLFESSIIIDHLDVSCSGRLRMVPADPVQAIEVRLMDRVFDQYVMTPMQRIVGDALREASTRDAFGVAEARALLDTAYAWLDQKLIGRVWAAGDAFSLADCAAAPALFYADWAQPIPASMHTLRDYRARVLARPSVAAAVDAARPYRHLFPLGAPDRD